MEYADEFSSYSDDSTPAATYSVDRTLASPQLEIWPSRSSSPDCKRLGVSPKWAATVRERLKRVGSSPAALKVSAVTKPTPGAVIRRWQTVSEVLGQSPGFETDLGDVDL